MSNSTKDGGRCPEPFECFNRDILFRKVLIPMSMGDDTKYPPRNGAFQNALVQYEANNAIYIYSSDGIYTKINIPSGVNSINGMGGDVTLFIPTKLSELQNDTGFITKSVSNLDNYSKTTAFSAVAFSGDYLDLSNRPEINNGELIINRNGATVGSFRANQKLSSTVNIRVPTTTSELANNSHFVSDANYVHTDKNFTSDLKNKLAHLANITEIGNNLTLTNGRLDAANGGKTEVYRGPNQPTDPDILIWIDTSGGPPVQGVQFITSENEDFITADNNNFTVKEN